MYFVLCNNGYLHIFLKYLVFFLKLATFLILTRFCILYAFITVFYSMFQSKGSTETVWETFLGTTFSVKLKKFLFHVLYVIIYCFLKL